MQTSDRSELSARRKSRIARALFWLLLGLAFGAAPPMGQGGTGPAEELARKAVLEPDIDRAVELLVKAVALEPKNARMHVELGSACGRKAHQASIFTKLSWARRSKGEFERAVELEPSSIESRTALLEFDLHVPGIAGGSIDEARAQAAAILAIDPFRGRVAGLEIAVHENEDAQKLMQLALRAAASDAQRAIAHQSLGFFLLETPERALPEFQQALVLDDRNQSARYGLALAYDKLDRKAEAIAAYKLYLALGPDGKRPDKVRARLKEL